MMVARHEVPGIAHKNETRPVGCGVKVYPWRADLLRPVENALWSTNHHTGPYGTDLPGGRIPGTSCQDFGELSRVATLTLSLRDTNRRLRSLTLKDRLSFFEE